MEDIEIIDDNGPVDIRLVSKYETELGFSFPDSYKLLVSNHDGLRPKKNRFHYKYNGKEETGDVTFSGYSNPENPESIRNVQQAVYSADNVVVFAICANGDYVVFNYQDDSEEPSVDLMLHDVYDDNGQMILVHLSYNFLSFVRKLG